MCKPIVNRVQNVSLSKVDDCWSTLLAAILGRVGLKTSSLSYSFINILTMKYGSLGVWT